MKKAITITIPEPCHEDWGKMTSTEKGKFCKVCTKEVFDFTNSTDEDLIKSLEAGKNLCGRFKSSQLDREVKLERKSGNGLLPYAASLLIPMGLLGASEAIAQGGPKVVENEFKSLRTGSNPVKSIVTICGFITDANNIPIANAEVFVLETGKSVRTAPDGSYKLVCTSGSTIYSMKDGLTSTHVLLGTKDAQVDMKLEPEMKEVVILAGLISTTPIEHHKNNEETPQKSIAEMLQGKIGKPDVKEFIEDKTATEITISGTVTDEQQMPLPGVNIIAKGTSIGVQTDFDGNYHLSVPPNSTLVFSYLAYETKEVTTSNISNEIDIDLNLTLVEEWLGEVVVVRRGLFGRIIEGNSAKRQARIAQRKEKSAERKASRMLKKASRSEANGKAKKK